MLSHFVRRDIRDLRLYWLISVANLILVMLIIVLSAMDCIFDQGVGVIMGVLGVYFYMSFIFIGIPITHIFGTMWRNQHYLSRYYLLSLPINRRTLFRLQQARALICGIPPALVAGIAPVVYVFFEPQACWLEMAAFLPFYYGLLAWLLFYLLHWSIYATVQPERITSYQSRQERLLRHLLFVLVMLGGLLPPAVLVLLVLDKIDMFMDIPTVVLILDLLFMLPLGAYFYLSNRAAWGVTLGAIGHGRRSPAIGSGS